MKTLTKIGDDWLVLASQKEIEKMNMPDYKEVLKIIAVRPEYFEDGNSSLELTVVQEKLPHSMPNTKFKPGEKICISRQEN